MTTLSVNPIVGATLVVALNWAGTRPAPTQPFIGQPNHPVGAMQWGITSSQRNKLSPIALPVNSPSNAGEATGDKTIIWANAIPDCIAPTTIDI